MAAGQAPPGSSWRNHPPGERPSPGAGLAGLGPRRCSALGQHAELLGTEKSTSVLSFHWKEERLLRRQLGLLDAMKKHEASARLTEQKAFYRRCRAQLQRVELAHARLRGDQDLVRQLTGQNRWSYSGASDESGAAVRAILQGRLEAAQPSPPVGGGRPGEDGAQAASRGTTQAEEPWWVLEVDARSRPQPVAQQSELPGRGDPPAPGTGRQPEGKLLLYVMHEDLGGERPTDSRPRPRGVRAQCPEGRAPRSPQPVRSGPETALGRLESKRKPPHPRTPCSS